MNPPDQLPPEDQSKLERRLAGWTPSPVASGRDRILFEAGFAAGRRQTRRRTAAILAVMAVGVGGWIVQGRAERRTLELALVERSRAREVALGKPEAPRQPALSPPDAPSPSSYLVLSRRLEASEVDQPGTIPSPSVHNRFPPHIGPVLTPISIRRPGDLVDL